MPTSRRLSVLAYRRPVLAVAAALAGWITLPLPPDLAEFAVLGRRLLDGRIDGVYDTAFNQAGPAQLLISTLLLVGGRDGTPHPALVALIDAGLVLAAMGLCRRLTGDRGVVLARRESVVGLVTVLWLAAPMPWDGHPAELAVGVCWMSAVALHRRGRSLSPALLLALGMAVAPWAVLGIPCLLGAPGLRRACRAGALACLLGAACYLPFVVTGHFALFGQSWQVADGTLWRLAGLREAGWGVRLAQGLVVAAGCATVARCCRGRTLVVAVAPLSAALLRVATDPVRWGYYWVPVAVTAVVALAMVPGAESRHRRVTVLLLGYLAYLSEAVGWTVPGAVGCLILVVVLVVPERHRAPAPPAVTPAGPTSPPSARRMRVPVPGR